MLIAFHWNDPAVQSSLIGAVGSFVTGIMAAVCAAVIGKQIAGRRRLQDKLDVALSDIAFLLKVEELHCAHRQTENDGPSPKLAVRKEVREKFGIVFSGRFTPGRVAYNGDISHPKKGD